MIEEIWKDIKGYEGLYQVSNIGRVKSLKRHRRGSGKELVCVNEKIKALQDNGHGYMTTTLYQNNKGQVVYIHRLVAVAFISNPNNLPCVNHINEDKSNNSASNLEWCSYEYNNNYGTKPKDCLRAIATTPIRVKPFYSMIYKETLLVSGRV